MNFSVLTSQFWSLCIQGVALGFIYVLISLGLSFLSQLGDLHESLTKRFFRVKDSSNLIPGHGGFYDRADSYLFVMPLFFYLFNG